MTCLNFAGTGSWILIPALSSCRRVIPSRKIALNSNGEINYRELARRPWRNHTLSWNTHVLVSKPDALLNMRKWPTDFLRISHNASRLEANIRYLQLSCLVFLQLRQRSRIFASMKMHYGICANGLFREVFNKIQPQLFITVF